MDINKYLVLPSSDNLTKPKYMAFLEAVLKNAILLGNTNESIGNAFDIANAAGKQLDIIGELVGLARLLPYVPANGTREMDDEEYRLALMLKVARNEWDGTNQGACSIYDKFFNDDVRVTFEDDQDLSVTIEINGALTPREAEILEATGVLLVPAGVFHTVMLIGGEVIVHTGTGCAVTGIEVYDQVKMY